MNEGKMMKNFLFVALFFILLVSCDKSELPQEDSTAEQRQLVDNFLMDIQSKLDALSVDVNVFRMPTIITDDTDGAAGVCYPNSHIRISKLTIDTSDSTPGRAQLWRVLAHEIGHCLFGLKHYEKQITAPRGHHFKIQSKEIYGGQTYCESRYNDWWAGSVMSSDHVSYSSSESVRIYYLKELAGRVDGTSYQEFTWMDGIDLVRSEDVDPGSIDTRPCQ